MRRAVAPLLAVTVAMVLADSAVVTLALPDILAHLDTTVGWVAWVLIAYNIVLGLAAVPAAMLLRHPRARPQVLTGVGIAVFAAASAACAAAGTIEILLAARCAQALGGALALVGCLVLLVAEQGERRGLSTWITAGVVGTATGPVLGGLLTEAISWQAIFVVQVPFAVLAVPAALQVRHFTHPRSPAPADGREGDGEVITDSLHHRPAIRANLTQALLSAALTAALFLLVLLLVQGWRHSPATAALTVSVVPIAALAAAPVARLFRTPHHVEVAVGCFLVAGGLAGLAVPPSSNLVWTVAPQALIGLGLGLTVDRLTTMAMEARLPQATHAGWTIAARHLGVVVGLAILTPIFTADLADAEDPAQEAITALVLDAPLRPETKIEVAQALGAELASQDGQVPDLSRAFDRLRVAPDEQAATDRLERALTDQLERAATRAFRDSFLVGAALALLALVATLTHPRSPARKPATTDVTHPRSPAQRPATADGREGDGESPDSLDPERST